MFQKLDNNMQAMSNKLNKTKGTKKYYSKMQEKIKKQDAKIAILEREIRKKYLLIRDVEDRKEEVK